MFLVLQGGIMLLNSKKKNSHKYVVSKKTKNSRRVIWAIAIKIIEKNVVH